MSEEIRRHLSSSDTWLRVLLVLVFAAAFYLGTLVAGAVAILALVILLLTGESNQPLAQFGRQLGRYLGQIVAFATLGSDQKPFPFGPWPQAGEAPQKPGSTADDSATADDDPIPEAPPAAGKTSSKKTTARKSTRKKTSKKAVSKKSTTKSSGES